MLIFNNLYGIGDGQDFHPNLLFIIEITQNNSHIHLSSLPKSLTINKPHSSHHRHILPNNMMLAFIINVIAAIMSWCAFTTRTTMSPLNQMRKTTTILTQFICPLVNTMLTFSSLWSTLNPSSACYRYRLQCRPHIPQNLQRL